MTSAMKYLTITYEDSVLSEYNVRFPTELGLQL